MFTGLVEDMGTLVGRSARGQGAVLTVRTNIDLTEVQIGDSIAVNGVCLTAESLNGDRFTATAGRETLSLTTLGGLDVGAHVHLERALRMGDRLGGHLVQGHVDGVGQVVSVTAANESVVVWIELPESLSRYVAAKGSVCVDGISLTVNEVDGHRFRVGIVPHTTEVTGIGHRTSGDRVNIEVDILAKYVERMLGLGTQSGVTAELLQRQGFLS